MGHYIQVTVNMKPQIAICLVLLVAAQQAMDQDGEADNRPEPIPRRQHSYSVEEKVRHVLDCQALVQQGRILNPSEYARRHHIPRSTLTRWIKDEDVLLEQLETSRNMRRVRTDHDGLWPDVENEVYEAFLESRRVALLVSRWWVADRRTAHVSWMVG